MLHKMAEIQQPAPDAAALLRRTAAEMGLRDKLIDVIDNLSFEIEVRGINQ